MDIISRPLKEKKVKPQHPCQRDPGNLQSRWAPCSPVHGPVQGQFPSGWVRPQEYLPMHEKRSLIVLDRPMVAKHQRANITAHLMGGNRLTDWGLPGDLLQPRGKSLNLSAHLVTGPNIGALHKVERGLQLGHLPAQGINLALSIAQPVRHHQSGHNCQARIAHFTTGTA